MKIEKTAVEGFKPYTISIAVETQEEHEMLSLLSSYSTRIPSLLDNAHGKVFNITSEFLNNLYNKVNR